MKSLFIFAALLVSFSAHAQDRKIGNVVAIEREIPNLKETCLKNTDDNADSKPNSFFACAFTFVSKSEIAITSGRVLTLRDKECNVLGEAEKGSIMITFTTTKIGKSTFQESVACLEKALATNNSLKLLVYSFE